MFLNRSGTRRRNGKGSKAAWLLSEDKQMTRTNDEIKYVWCWIREGGMKIKVRFRVRFDQYGNTYVWHRKRGWVLEPLEMVDAA